MTLRQRLLAAVLISLLPMFGAGAAVSQPAEVSNTLARLPLSFEPNYGQSGRDVEFLSRAPGYLLQLTATGMRMIVPGSSPDPRGPKALAIEDASREEPEVAHALRFTWVGANARAETSTESPLPGTVNYLKGSDPAKWRTSIPTFERVRYHDMYPGIDLLYYGNGRQLEYDLIVAPGADPEVIRMSIEGAETVLTKSGDLDLILSDGRTLQLRTPVIYQQSGGERLPIEGRYRLAHRDGGVSEIAFEIAAYDSTLPLVIEPLIYSTVLSRSGGYVRAQGIAVNAAGEAFVTGYTTAINFPTTAGAFDTTHNGHARDWSAGIHSNVFVTRLNASGTALLYSTFLGGGGPDAGYAIAVNEAGEAFVTGGTSDVPDEFPTDFPTTAGAFRGQNAGWVDAFVARLNSTGTALVYSTFLGGIGFDSGYGIAVNDANEAFVTGTAGNHRNGFSVTDFPTTAGAFDTSPNGGHNAFVTRLNAGGTALVYSTFLGSGLGLAIAVNAASEAYVTGQVHGNFPTSDGAFDITSNGADAFVTRLNADGTALLYSTFLGGGLGLAIAVNAANEAFVTGRTHAIDFPTTAGAFDNLPDAGVVSARSAGDAFVTRLNSTGTALVYSTFLGGSGFDGGSAIAVNAANEAFVTGFTDATDFPTTPGAFDTLHDGARDAFVTRLNSTGTALVYSTFLGGIGYDEGLSIAVNAANEAFVTGSAGYGFPTTAGAFNITNNGGAFVTRLNAGGTALVYSTFLGANGRPRPARRRM